MRSRIRIIYCAIGCNLLFCNSLLADVTLLLNGNSAAGSVPPPVRATLLADVSTLVSGNNGFAFDIYHRLASTADADKNLLVSPFSISSALAMTYAGAQGHTATQMADVLGFNLPDSRLHSAFGELVSDLTADRPAYQLNIANRLFGQSGYPFKQTFLDVTANDYHAPLEPTEFIGDAEGSRQRINNWVADQTHDKILNLLPPGSVSQDTRLVLTNAIYFNGKWKYKFDEQNTTNRTFYSANGAASTAPTMFQDTTLRYGQFDGYKVLEMPYTGDDLSIVVLLPTANDGITSLEQSLTPAKLNSDLASMFETEVNVFLPKFKFDASFKLGKTLKDMGMGDAFDPSIANFSGIVAPEIGQLHISDVIHKAFIDVNEAGTEAAAATATTINNNCVCGPPQPMIFDVDHPFLFALRDTHSGSLLFMGRVMQPGNSSISSLTGPAVPEPSAGLLFLFGVGFIAAGKPRSPFRQRCGLAR